MARTAKAVAAVDETNELPEKIKVHLVEVELLRKYAPHLCYKDESEVENTDENGCLVPIDNLDPNDPYPYQKQVKVLAGEAFNQRYNRMEPKYREIMEDFYAGRTIKLPTAEAHHCLSLNIARVTVRTLVS